MFRSFRRTVFAAAVSLSFGLAFAPAVQADEALSGLQRQILPTDGSSLQPGLAVRYYFAMFDFMWEMERLVRSRPGHPGDPVLKIDTFFEEYDEHVFTADRTQGVGALINGLMHFPEAGLYHLAILSNDGIRIELGGKFLFEDPDKHINGNRMSDPIPVEIAEAGWYPININYFQKKGTWALDLLWAKPGEEVTDDLPIVPEDAYAHLPNTEHVFVNDPG
ncbi:MAG: PA14 domain-containing protein [Alphaproteobacteria bacterium]